MISQCKQCTCGERSQFSQYGQVAVLPKRRLYKHVKELDVARLNSSVCANAKAEKSTQWSCEACIRESIAISSGRTVLRISWRTKATTEERAARFLTSGFAHQQKSNPEADERKMASNGNAFQLDLVAVEPSKCPICMNKLHEPRRAPDCGHYLCAPCLDTLEMSTSFEHVRSLHAYARVRTFVCPACGAPNRIAGESLDSRRSVRSRRPDPAPETVAVLEPLAVSDGAAKCHCSVHETRRDNVMFCEDCKAFCCSEECVQRHPRHLLRSAAFVFSRLRDEYLETDRRLASLGAQLGSANSSSTQFTSAVRADVARHKDAVCSAVAELKTLLDDLALRTTERLDTAAALLASTDDQGAHNSAELGNLNEAVGRSRLLVHRLLCECDAHSMIDNRAALLSTCQTLENSCAALLPSAHAERQPFVSHARHSLETLRSLLSDQVSEQNRRPICFGTLVTLRDAVTLISTDDLLSSVGSQGKQADCTLHTVHVTQGNVYVSCSVGKAHYVVESRGLASLDDCRSPPNLVNVAGASFIRRRNTRIVCRVQHACVAIQQLEQQLLLCLANCTVVAYDLDTCTPSSVRLSLPASRANVREAFAFNLPTRLVAVCFQHAAVMHVLRLDCNGDTQVREAECSLVPDVTSVAHDTPSQVIAIVSHNQLLFCDEKLKVLALARPPPDANIAWSPQNVRACDSGVFFVADSDNALHVYDPYGQHVARVGSLNHSVWSVAAVSAASQSERNELHISLLYFDESSKLLKHSSIATAYRC